MKNEVFIVGGMSCSACSARVQSTIDSLQGVENASVNLLTGTMSVQYNENIITIDAIIKAVEGAGYTASLKSEESKDAKQQKLQKNANTIKYRLILSVVCLLLLMIVSMGHMIGINIIPHDMIILKGIVEFLLMLPVAILNFKYFTSGIKAIVKLSPNMDSLISVGAISSVIYSFWLLLSGGATHYYFESAAMILTFVTVGKFIESKSKAKTTSAINKLLDLSPKKSLIIIDGKETEIDSEDIKVGDIVVVKSGMIIPVDGIVISGSGNTDESAITGESIPLEKYQGSTVTSGTMLINGYLTFEAKRVGKDTTLSGIIKLVEEATTSKPKIAKFADTVSRYFVPAVILISILTGVIWYVFSKDFELSLNFAISVLVISCPCALGLATPTAIMVGSGRAAELGILIKSAEIFETADSINTVLFDKTGTITQGLPSVVSFISEKYSDDEFLEICSALESRSDHPLAQAIVRHSSTSESITVENFYDVTGKGVGGNIDGNNIKIGNRKFISDCEMSEKIIVSSDNISNQGATAVYVAENGKVIGIIGIADTVKESAKETIEMLKRSGVQTVMITGDNAKTAEYIRKAIGIDKVYAELLPADKNTVIKEYQQTGRCAMVGDGINDSPALTAADVGIALGAGTDIAMDAADVVLMNNDLRDVYKTLEICKKVMRNIRQNLFWALIYNSLCIPIAAGALYPIFSIKLSPAIGTIAMSLSSIFVVTNALRLRRIRKNYHAKQKETIITKKEELVVKTVFIDGMMCPHCEARVKSILSEFDSNVVVDHTKGTAVLDASADNDKIKAAVEAAGYKVTEIK